MTESRSGRADRGITPARPWGRLTVVLHLTLFAIPATMAWRSSPDRTVYLPMVALVVAFALGVLLLFVPSWRGAGGRVIAATVLAAALDVGLAVVLVVAYSNANPGWDLS